MATDPPPPPEAALITTKIDAILPEPPSRSELARRAGISPSLWAKIEKGYEVVRGGDRVPFRGSDRAVAAMASATGVTAAELRACGRPGAAKVLSARTRSEPEPDNAARKSDIDALKDEVRGLRSDIDSRLAALAALIEKGNRGDDTQAKGRRAG